MWLPVHRLTMMLHMAKIHITQEASNITFLRVLSDPTWTVGK